jgi:hypothetical protein
MRFEKHRKAKTWEELGLMGDSLSYTDEEILTVQALGYTKHTAGTCNPMDVAVLYSIVNEGEGVELTAKDMLNDYTRLAYLFEEGRIIDGYMNVESSVQCDGFHNQHNLKNYWDSRKLSYISSIIKDLVEKKRIDLIEKHAQVLCGWNRDKSGEAHAFNHYEAIKALANDTADLDFKYQKYISSSYTTNGTINNISLGDGRWINAHGICNDTSVDKPCSIHNIHGSTKRVWVHTEDFKILHHGNSPTSHGNFQPHSRYVIDDTVEYIKDSNRAYTNIVEDKIILRSINKSLNRMLKRFVILQTSEGRGRKFKWYDGKWQQIQNQRMKIMASNSKKRKLGDVVNGWEYFKMSTAKSFGMEIVTYGWKPKDELEYFTVKFTGKKIYSNNVINEYGSCMGKIFYDESTAQSFINSLSEMLSSLHGGINMFNILDEDFNTHPILPSLTVSRKTPRYRVSADADVESYSTPQQVMKQHHLLGIKWNHKNQEMFCTFPNAITLTKKIKKEVEE